MMWRYISRRAAWGEGEEEGNKKNALVAARAEECVRACHYGDDRPESAGKVDSSNMAVRWLATRHDENAIAHDDGRTRVARNYALCWHAYAREIDERAWRRRDCQELVGPTRVFRKTWRKQHSGAHRDAMATSSCRVHALLCHGGGERARPRLTLPFIYITRLLTRAQLAFSRDPSRVSAPNRWRRLDAKKYINQVNICRVSSSYAGRIT